MKKILFIQSPERTSAEAKDFVLKEGVQFKAKVVFVYIVDEDSIRELELKLANYGTVGDQTAIELGHALTKEYQERGRGVIAEFLKKCSERGIIAESHIETGLYMPCVEEFLAKSKPDLTVVAEKKVKFFKRIFEGSELTQIKRLITTELKVFPSE